MPQKQTLVTFNTQNLNATDIDHFFNIDESYIENYRTVKCMYNACTSQIYSCSLDYLYLKTVGSTIASRDNLIQIYLCLALNSMLEKISRKIIKKLVSSKIN